MADGYSGFAVTPDSNGTKGAMITPNDGADMAQVAKAIVVTSIAGGAVLEVLPVGNADGAWVPFAGVVVGFTPPFRVRRVRTTTTCLVAAVYD